MHVIKGSRGDCLLGVHAVNSMHTLGQTATESFLLESAMDLVLIPTQCLHIIIIVARC